MLTGLFVVSVLAAAVFRAIRPPAVLNSTRWGLTWPFTTGALFRVEPRTGVALLDEELYLGTLQRVARGEGYYDTHHAMLRENPDRWDPHSPLTYRQPLLTYLWALLGAGATIGIVWAIAAGLSMTAAYLVAERLLDGAWPTMLAPFGLAVVNVAMLLHPPRILYNEMWAAPPLVLGAASCALVLQDAAAPPRRQWAISCTGAACVLVAMLFRELALPFAMVMCVALLVDRRARTSRLWIPWALAICVWIGAYAVHVARVRSISTGDPPFPISQSDLIASYFHPGFAFLAACVRWVSANAFVVPVVTLLIALAVIGVARVRRLGLLVLVGGTTLGSLAALTVSGTFGTYPDGNCTGYWGYLFIPVMLAWSPLGVQSPAGTPPAPPAIKRRGASTR